MPAVAIEPGMYQVALRAFPKHMLLVCSWHVGCGRSRAHWAHAQSERTLEAVAKHLFVQVTVWRSPEDVLFAARLSDDGEGLGFGNGWWVLLVDLEDRLVD